MLDMSKLKVLVVTKMMISVSHQVENIMGKGENASSKHFLLFSHFLQV